MSIVPTASTLGNTTDNATHTSTLAWRDIVYIAFCFTFGIMIGFGNIMTIIVVCKEDLLQTVPNKFILNLAVTDLLICIECIFEMLTITGIEQFVSCLMLSSLWQATSLMSLVSLLLIAVDRFVYISRPLHYHLIITTKRANVVIAASWLVGLTIFNIEVILKYWHNLTKICSLNSPTWLRKTMLFVFPTLNVIMLILYGLLIRIAMKQRRRVTDSNNGFKPRLMLASDFKFLKLILSVVMFSEAYWIPYIIIYGIVLDRKLENIAEYWRCLGALFYLNSAVNFFIYAARDKDLYNGYKRLLSLRR